MRLALALFHWFPYGGLQQDLLKVAAACRTRATVSIHCLQWEGPLPEGVQVEVVAVAGCTRESRQRAFARHLLERVRPAVDLLLGFNRLPGLDYYFAADSCFAYKALHERPWWYRFAPRARQQLRFEAAVFGADSATVALLLSGRQRQQYEAVYHTPAARLLDLPPGIDRRHCASADAPALRLAFRQALAIPAAAPVVLQIGSSYHTKGLDRSLAAIAALPPALRECLYFLVLGRDRRAAHWQRRASRLGLGERLRFLPPGQSIREAMQGADLLLHPSRHESAGLVILEAVVAGLPVLTTAACGYAEHVSRAGAGLVCPEPFRQESLDASLHAMLEDEEQRGRWRAQGIDYGRTQSLYDMPGVVADLLLAAGRSSP
jgi:UDP-glucose:(heptosyl)LPS alpha-1,3-glucosyltransferase